MQGQMTPDQYASTIVTLVSLGALALGLLAMLVRALVRRRNTLRRAGRQLVADVKKGEGFTFHHTLKEAAPTNSRQEAPPQALALRQWLDLVNNRPDNVPHLFIQGGSGTGKTTFTKAVLTDRSGPIAIVGVKPDDEWGQGYIYRSAERKPALTALLAEVNRRLDENDRSGLTIVLDDFTRLASDHRSAVELYKLVADVGRSLRIRLILIARGRLVKAIGASGESDLREHFVFISLQRDHSATLEYDEQEYLLDTHTIPELSKPLAPARWWRPQLASKQPTPPAHARRDREYLSSLLADDLDVPVRAAAGLLAGDPERTSTTVHAGTPHQDAVPPEIEDEDCTEGVPARLTPEAIRTLYNSGWSKNRIAAMLTGTKSKRIAIIDAALEKEPAA